MLSEKMALNVGYMWTNYHDYTKKSENYCGTNLPGTNVYSLSLIHIWILGNFIVPVIVI